MNLKKNNWHYNLWKFNFSKGYKEPTNNFYEEDKIDLIDKISTELANI